MSDALNSPASASPAAPATATQTSSENSLVEELITRGRAKDKESLAQSRDLASEFVSRMVDQLKDGQGSVTPNTHAMIGARIAQVDRLLSLQLNEILHAPQFQRLESSWRGLRYLMD